jgi:selenide,water dikinase
MRGRALPKSGVYAVRMGPPLTENLRRAARGEPLRPFRPQRRTLALISTGRRHAIASRGTLALSGDWVWRIKDWIDRRWMRRYQELPEMAGNAGDGTGTMHCGGCGAKVPAATVRAVLARLGARTADAHVALGLARPDDAAVLEVPTGEVLVQSVDHFRALLDDPYEFGRVTAVHCLGDLHAMGARPLAALATATLAWAAPEKQAAELEQLLRGAIDVIEAEGAVLAGGHTAEGPETAFGLTVNGLAARDALMTKGGLREGDALVLTKALGTGVVFAADMRAKASAGTIEAALTSMGRSSASAARIIAAHGAAGCTDVTGFGLAGHLLEMLDASGTDAIVDADALPVLPGALELLERGLRSTLQPGNEAAGDRVLGQCDAARRALLFDPQTAGGLLAGVPAAQATACVAALRAAGDGSACIIGSVHARAGAASAIRLRS